MGHSPTRYDKLAANFLSAVALAPDLVLALRGNEMVNPAMNNTRWDELRLEMYALMPTPSWWFYHFREADTNPSFT